MMREGGLGVDVAAMAFEAAEAVKVDLGLPALDSSSSSASFASSELRRSKSREHIFKYVTDLYTDEGSGAPVGDKTAKNRLTYVKKFIASVVPLAQRRSVLSVFSDVEAVRVFFTEEVSSSQKAHVVACFVHILERIGQDLDSNDPEFHRISASVPSCLSSLKRKGQRDWTLKHRENVSTRSAERDAKAGGYRQLQERVAAEVLPRVELLLRAAISYVSQVRMPEEEAAALMVEIQAKKPSATRPDPNTPFMTRGEEDAAVFGREEPEEEDSSPDCAGNFLRMKKFPPWLVSEITAGLQLAIHASVKPERSQSLRCMTLAEGRELEQWCCAILPVWKLCCTFDYSYCIVNERVAEVLGSYRLWVRPLILRGLRRDGGLEEKDEVEGAGRAGLEEEISSFYREFHAKPLSERLTARGGARGAVWRYIGSSLAERHGALPSARIQRIYNEANSDQNYFMTPYAKPLDSTDFGPILGCLDMGGLTVTDLRRWREQMEAEMGDRFTQELVHAAESHSASTARKYYINSSKTNKEVSLSLSLSLCQVSLSLDFSCPSRFIRPQFTGP